MQNPVLISYGGGVNSTAMIIAMVKLKYKIDAIVFADTGAEKPETYENINHVSTWLESNEYPPITIVKRNETLEEYCLEREMLPSLAYGFHQCSGDFKIKPIHNWVKNWPIAKTAWDQNLKVVKCIGFDSGDRDRIRAAKFKDDYPSKYQLKYPLIEMQINRSMCISIVESIGIKNPVKSCCFFCPAHKKHEIVELAEKYPELFKRALDIEENAKHTLETTKGLGRNFSWKSYEKANKSQLKMFDDFESSSIPCVCNT